MKGARIIAGVFCCFRGSLRFYPKLHSMRKVFLQLFLSAISCAFVQAQPAFKAFEGKTYEVYFWADESGILIDSLPDATSGRPKLMVLIEFPVLLNSKAVSEEGGIRYNAGLSDSPNCGYRVIVSMTSDSISFSTEYPLSYDPCLGHTDAADWIWEALGGKKRYSWKMLRDGLMIYDADRRVVIALHPGSKSKKH
jgi:hypothetical protein